MGALGYPQLGNEHRVRLGVVNPYFVEEATQFRKPVGSPGEEFYEAIARARLGAESRGERPVVGLCGSRGAAP
ncbi:hypothetical protein SRABI128_04456 [Microbacterium sp. Bi128]|nr:hypothetical protein SRABI128_04456 [Microbacterium sp. Bi128]